MSDSTTTMSRRQCAPVVRFSSLVVLVLFAAAGCVADSNAEQQQSPDTSASAASGLHDEDSVPGASTLPEASEPTLQELSERVEATVAMPSTAFSISHNLTFPGDDEPVRTRRDGTWFGPSSVGEATYAIDVVSGPDHLLELRLVDSTVWLLEASDESKGWVGLQQPPEVLIDPERSPAINVDGALHLAPELTS